MTDSQEPTANDGVVEDVAKPTSGPEETEYPPLRTVLLVMFALYLTVFLTALDRLIIATAIPAITDDFHSLGDIGWYASGYLLTACAFQLVIGRIYTFYNPKWVFLICIAIFELGSLVCGVSKNSTAFIVGRAIAGLGSGGIFSGAITIIIYLVPLHKRPAYTGVVGAVFGLASVAGPLLGGLFTTHVTWRWCFYINLPMGGITIAIIIFILKLPHKKKNQTLRQQLAQLDPLGTVVFLPAIVCILIALQWGGTTYPWKDGRIIALLVLFAVLIIIFIAIQIWKQDTATVPPRIIKNRSIAAGMWFTLVTGGSMMVLVYYIPVWFQAIEGVSAVESGIRNLPLILGLVVSSIFSGFLTRKIGYYTQWMIVCAVLMPIGAGLISTWTPSTGRAKWIGYQVVFGLGLGLGMQQSNVAAQTVLAKKDAPIGVSVMFFTQTLGGAVFTSVASNIFDNELAKGVRGIAGLDPATVVKVGATELRNYVSAQDLPVVLDAYNSALTKCFDVAVALACCAIFGALAMEWKSIKKDQPGGKGPARPKSAGTRSQATTEKMAMKEDV